MGIDINGYALTNPDQLTFGASQTKVHAATYGIKVPTLPAMCGSCMAGGTNAIFPLPVNDVNVNIGSHWSTSSYAFTAPVAGIYYTSFGGIVGDGGGASATYGYWNIILNGVLVTYSYHHCLQWWDLHHLELQLKMQAGDYIQWAMNISPGTAAGPSGVYRSNHNVVTIWLIG